MPEILQTYQYKGGSLRLWANGSTGGPLGVTQAEPARAVAAPGAGRFEFGGLRVEREGDQVALRVRLSGHQLAYLYTELLLKDPARDRYYGPVMREYIRSERHEGSSGITRPVWDEQMDLQVRLRPTQRLLTDGVLFAFCFALPEGYSSPGYRQGGVYTLAGQTGPYRALLGFSADGSLKRAIAYSEQVKVTGPKVLTPAEGDRFVPSVQLFTPSPSEGRWDIGAALADELTVGSRPLRVITDKPIPGEYLLGVVAQDLDGGFSRRYLPVSLD